MLATEQTRQTFPVENVDRSLLDSLLTDDVFRPVEPASVEETGLSDSLIETLVIKQLAVGSGETGRGLAQAICLPFGVV